MFKQSKNPNGLEVNFLSRRVRLGNSKRSVSLAAMVEVGTGDAAAAVR
jgi:hypothetical protein